MTDPDEKKPANFGKPILRLPTTKAPSDAEGEAPKEAPPSAPPLHVPSPEEVANFMRGDKLSRGKHRRGRRRNDPARAAGEVPLEQPEIPAETMEVIIAATQKR